MNEAPRFAPYPRQRQPAYGRWLGLGASLLLLISSASALFNPLVESPVIAVLGAALLVLWLLALLLRVLFYRLNGHNAQCYDEAATRVACAWWQRHRDTAALVESVLIAPAFTTLERSQKLLDPDGQPATPPEAKERMEVGLIQLMEHDSQGRERELALILAAQWRGQQPKPPPPWQPLRCYWLGSLGAWQVFVDQSRTLFPALRLPQQPEPWLGIQTIDSIIDQLRDAPQGSRMLCGGCQSSTTAKNGLLPHGEAAVLWVIGQQGGVKMSRGEWFDADGEDLAVVAARALEQGHLDAPTKACFSFSQPNVPAVQALNWNLKPYLQDARFGALADLEAMVLQTLAAWHAQEHGTPCAWLANDPAHTLTLGVMQADDASH